MKNTSVTNSRPHGRRRKAKDKKSYFGQDYVSWQGLPSRHIYMLATVQFISKNSGRPYLNMLEIGSWAGGSALTWAEGISRYNSGRGVLFCIDSWEIYFNPKDYDDEWNVFYEMERGCKDDNVFSLFIHNVNAAGFKDYIIPIRGKSNQVLPYMRPKQFDLIFIDGSHTYHSVADDIRKSLPLLREGGIICGDDLELQIEECDIKAAKASAHLEYAKDPKTKKFFHPGVSLAVGEIFGSVSVWDGFWAMRKIKNRWYRLKLDGLELRMPKHLHDAIQAGAVSGASIKGISVKNPIR